MAFFGKQIPAQRLYLLAVLAGVAGGTLILALRHNYESAAQSMACAQSLTRAKSLAPFIKGEVAAFSMASREQILPDFSFADSGGKPQNAASLHGKITLLNLWASWCVPCREEMPALDRLQEKLGDKDFSVVPISLDLNSDEKPKAFYREIKIASLPFFHDAAGEVFRELRKLGLVAGLPTTILIDRKGCILGHMSGPADWSSDDAAELIRAVLARHPDAD